MTTTGNPAKASRVIPPLPRLSCGRRSSFALFPGTFVLIAPRRGFHFGTILAGWEQVCYAHDMNTFIK